MTTCPPGEGSTSCQFSDGSSGVCCDPRGRPQPAACPPGLFLGCSSSGPSGTAGCQVSTGVVGTPSCSSRATERTADGSCNSLSDTRRGMAGTLLARTMTTTYEDGTDSPRSKSVTGTDLSSARAISQAVVDTITESPHGGFTQAVMQWGQFVDHDIVITPLSDDIPDTGCCTSDNADVVTSGDCLSIEIAATDTYFGSKNRRCMDFHRSHKASSDCTKRQQQNGLTHYIDGSNIYGSSAEETAHLRSGSGGQLRAQADKNMLPEDTETAGCEAASDVCFLAGDERVNEQAGLTVMHTLWMREHNRVAVQLQQRHRDWSDEQLFQAARKIVIGELQHITYNEFLPTLLQQDFIIGNDMVTLGGDRFTNRYKSGLDATISNEFATAAYRFGHSLVNNLVNLYDTVPGAPVSQRPLHELFFDPSELYTDGRVRQYACGLAAQPAQNTDRLFAFDLVNRLFETDAEMRDGLDLTALNIQRGREHGLATYNDARRALGLQAATWSSLANLLQGGSATVEKLKQVYASPEDIDLFVAGVMEKKNEAVLLGPTFTGIIGDQFIRLQHGDRYFFDSGTDGLTGAQVGEIRKSSLARVLCDNVPAIGGAGVVQPLAFRVASTANPVSSCTSAAIPTVDLTKF